MPAVSTIILLMLLLPRVAYLKIVSGMVAKRVCSEIFVAGRDAKGAFREETNMFWEYTSFDVDEVEKTVTAYTLGLWSQVAVWRQGFGCTLVRGTSVEKLQKQTLDLPSVTDQKNLPWPQGDHLPEQGNYKKIDLKKLNKILDWAFEERDLEHLKNTRAVIVLYQGKIIAERYASGFTNKTPFLGWSLTKGVTHGIIGAAVQQKLISVNQFTGFIEWEYSERSKITLDHLLTMSSGLDFNEWPGSDLTDMLILSSDMTREASEEGLEYSPGSHWSYSSASTILAMRVLRDALDEKSYPLFPYKSLFHKIDIHSATFETDPSGNFVASSYLYMTARDWARFSLLYAQKGVWEGNQILPDDWVDYGCTPTETNQHYGAHWWVNSGKESNPEDRKYKSLPGNLCYLSGFEEQLIAILPDQDLVILRFGITPDIKAFRVEKFISKIIQTLVSPN